MAMQGLKQMATPPHLPPPEQELAYAVFSPTKSQTFSSMWRAHFELSALQRLEVSAPVPSWA